MLPRKKASGPLSRGRTGEEGGGVTLGSRVTYFVIAHCCRMEAEDRQFTEEEFKTRSSWQ